MGIKKVAFVIAFDGFQPIEYRQPKKILEDAGIQVITVSTNSGSAIAADGSPAHVQVLLRNLIVNEYQGIFFIGGPGAIETLDTPSCYNIIKQAYAAKKLVGAICISTRILASAGILQGKRATGWNDDNKLEDFYQYYNVTYVPDDVVIDGTIITASGPSAAIQFGETILNLITNENGWG